jgi:DNA-binding MarR family transcriptional regulator
VESKLRGPLNVFGISREEFRLMVMLHRDGRQKLTEAEEKLGRSRESLYETIERGEEFGWVRRGVAHLPAAEMRASQLPRELREKPRVGRRVRTIELTEQGSRLVGIVLPKHEEMLRSLMAEVDSREIETLIRICQKIRREDDLSKMRFGHALIRASEEFDQEERGGEPEDSD